MEKVFISYSHKDKDWVVNWLLPRLEEAGVKTHIDFRDFKIGSASIRNMREAVKNCRWTLLVLTPNWVSSEWTQFESLLLQTKDPTNITGRLLPLMKEQCEPPDELGIFTYANFKEQKNWDNELQRLLKSFKDPGGFFEKPPPGPPKNFYLEKRISLSKLPITGKYFFGREKQLKILDDAWAGDETRIVSFIAWGGVGKSALVNQWLNKLAVDNYHGAKHVYGWSFYSQGAEEGKQASADTFFQETLQWFGDPDPTDGDATAKARRLVELINKEKTLLILDGLEPLQYPPGAVKGFDGKFKDNALRTFLRELAMTMNGLCILTSRETLTDLEDKTGLITMKSATKAQRPQGTPRFFNKHSFLGVLVSWWRSFYRLWVRPASWRIFQEIQLDHLSENTGVKLFQQMGLKGLETDFKEAVNEYGGHALALTLLGQYIKAAYNSDIRERDKIPKLTGERKKGAHAIRVMRAYQHWLGDSAERNILVLSGLFDRPAERGAVDALIKEPPIKGLTEQLQSISPERWNTALTNLRDAGLLAPANPDKPGGLDCHPLVRECFAEKLKTETPAAWTEANRRLYVYYKESQKKFQPDTLEEMEPLFAAVAHGCRAGLYEEARYEVYLKRIKRGGRENYCCNRLGAFGADLAALAHFFETPWSTPAAALAEEKKALVLGWAAFRLRALGRLTEARQAMEADLDLFVKLENWKQAASAANNLSELLLTLGATAEAVHYGEASVRHADQSGDEFTKMAVKPVLAEALNCIGKLEDAGKRFLEAEDIQKQFQPDYPQLYGIAGYRFCDLLLGLDSPKVDEVTERAEKGLKIALDVGDLLSIALDTLTLGRARMLRAEQGDGDFTAALNHLDRAVQGLRKYGSQQHLPRGLLARAACRRLMTDYPAAHTDLDEAEEIARLGSMKRYLVDYHLESGKLLKAEGKKGAAQEHYDTAEKLIEETGYKRRSKELGDRG